MSKRISSIIFNAVTRRVLRAFENLDIPNARAVAVEFLNVIVCENICPELEARLDLENLPKIRKRRFSSMPIRKPIQKRRMTVPQAQSENEDEIAGPSSALQRTDTPPSPFNDALERTDTPPPPLNDENRVEFGKFSFFSRPAYDHCYKLVFLLVLWFKMMILTLPQTHSNNLLKKCLKIPQVLKKVHLNQCSFHH